MMRDTPNDFRRRKVQYSSLALSFLLLSLASGICGAQTSSSAAAYPQRPIRMIVGFPPGGSTDLIARLLSQRLAANLGQQVVVDNRAGAGTSIASEVTARANPDGYTLFITVSALTTTAAVSPKSSPDPISDFTAIMLLARSPLRVVVNAKVPAGTIQEFSALAKSKPGSLNYGTPGTGTSAHLAIELFRTMAGVNIVHVPYKGTGPAMTDLIAGQIQLMFAGTLSALPNVKSGRIRELAVTSLQRRTDSPGTPTLAETVAPGYEHMDWFGVLGPPGLPRPLLARIYAELARAVKDPQVGERLAGDGMDVVAGGPESFSALIKSDFEKWKRVVKNTKITVE